MNKTWIIIGVIVLILAVWVGGTYNSLVTKDEAITTQWAQVETSYQRRFDLIPNLVESVKGAMSQEKTVFAALADARTRYSGATTPDAKAAAASQVESALSRLLVIVENYPQLKSIEAVQLFMSELSGTENRVSVERGRYNEKVQTYNVDIKRFPGSVIASLFGFAERAYFKANESAANAPQVKF
jgi:LemA protein